MLEMIYATEFSGDRKKEMCLLSEIKIAGIEELEGENAFECDEDI